MHCSLEPHLPSSLCQGAFPGRFCATNCSMRLEESGEHGAVTVQMQRAGHPELGPGSLLSVESRHAEVPLGVQRRHGPPRAASIRDRVTGSLPWDGTALCTLAVAAVCHREAWERLRAWWNWCRPARSCRYRHLEPGHPVSRACPFQPPCSQLCPVPILPLPSWEVSVPQRLVQACGLLVCSFPHPNP